MLFYLADPSPEDMSQARNLGCCDGVVFSTLDTTPGQNLMHPGSQSSSVPCLIQLPPANKEALVDAALSLIRLSPTVIPCLSFSLDALQAVTVVSEREMPVAVRALQSPLHALMSVRAGARMLLLEPTDADDPLDVPTQVISLLDNYAYDAEVFVNTVGRGVELVEECGLLGVDGVVCNISLLNP